MSWLRASSVALFVVAGCAPLPVGVGTSVEAQKVCAPGATTMGIDVSHWDGAIDWAKVKAAGVEFAFMKATEGTTFVDPQFAAYYRAAPQNGILRGAYHFFRPADDAVKQADFFVDTVGQPASGDLPLTLDLETTDNLPVADVAAGALAFLARVEARTGRVPIVYTSARVFDTVLGTPAGFGHYLLWNAQWDVTCPSISSPTWTTWTFWQTADTGQLAGLSNLDVDEFNGSYADLVAFARGPVSPPLVSDGGGVDDSGASDATDGGSDDRAHTGDGADGFVTTASSVHGCDYSDGRPTSTMGLLLFAVAVAMSLVGARLRRRR